MPSRTIRGILAPGESLPSRRWLGLVPGFVPDGLHGRNRERLVKRHTTWLPHAGDAPGGRTISQALVKTYGRLREAKLMHMLRPRQLDDTLWRDVYALIVTATPVNAGSLINFVTRITGVPDVARQEAEFQLDAWYRAHAVMAEDPTAEPDQMHFYRPEQMVRRQAQEPDGTE